MLKRLLVWTFLAAVFYALIQFIPAYFYASEFDDFVKDDVKFTPMRENTEEGNLADQDRKSVV